ncbi:hypothetical protein BE21_57470 [Sorangium cellulosum]|uniref:Uncharacterized protein n=1 Tax=Sorangium cellulosum TaxID=56 RepID=A0A150U3B8_SORCE|nr:hypothetical protein BE21_57470 [Sorangium cellulosum]
MSTITGDNVFPADFEGPDDGDDRDAAGTLIGMEALADRTVYLKNRLEGNGAVTISDLTVTGNADFQADVNVDGELTASEVTTGSVATEDIISDSYLVASRTVERCYEGACETDDSWSFQEDGVTPNQFLWIATATGTHKLKIGFPAKSGWTVTKVEARVKAQAAHVGLPTVMPTLTLVRRNITGSGPATQSWTASDQSLTLGVYQADHWIPVTVSPGHVVAGDSGIYYAVLATESGTNALAGLQFFGLRVTYTYTRVDEV